jgi:spermidine synthase
LPARDRLSSAALFVLSALILSFEIAQIRVFSFAMDPHVVFGAISMAMLGLGGAGVSVALRPPAQEGALERVPGLLVAFGVATAVTMAIFARLSPLVSTTSLGLVVLTASPLLLLCAIPYGLGGLATTLLLSQSARRPHVFYLFNLLGSALGCFLLYPFLRPFGVERILGVISLVAVLAGAGLAVALGERKLLRRGLVGVLVAGGACLAPVQFFPFQSDPADLYANAERAVARFRLPAVPGAAPGRRSRREFAEWDPVSRVEVFQFPGLTGLINNTAPVKVLLHDGGAGSLLFGLPGHPEIEKALFEGTTYGGAYTMVPHPENALVIGLGGGPDIMAAHHFGARKITGVEVNGSTLRATREAFASFLGDPYGRPNVTLLHLDGRSFVEGTRERYDLIQLSGTDTYSAGASGAFMFSESYLYTIEAVRRYLESLTPGGVLAMIRFGPEPLRLVLTEIEALRSLGVTDPGQHLAILGQGPCQIVLCSRQPITPEQKDRARAMVAAARSLPAIDAPINSAMGFGVSTLQPLEVVYLPGDDQSIYGHIFQAARAGNELEAVRHLDFDFTPVTDDRPFFFQFLGPAQIDRVFSSKADDFFARGLRGHLLLLLVLGVSSALLLVGPLLSGQAGGLRRESLGAPLTYFAAIGAGFLLIELALMQQTALFLGHPTYSISVTLFALLAWSGVGSLLAGRLSLATGPLLRAVTAALAGAVLFALIAYGPIFRALLPLPLAARGAILVLLLAPLGLPMGVFFPTGLRALADRGEGVLAWSQAANGLSSVLASLIAAPLAMFLGFKAVLLLAVALYVLATSAARRLEPAAPGTAA